MKEIKKCADCKNVGEDLCHYLRKHLDEKLELCETAFSSIEIQSLTKITALLAEGNWDKQAFWLQSGYGRYFGVRANEYGREIEVTVDFCKPRKIIFVREYFLTGMAIKCDLQLTAGSVIIPFHIADFDHLQLDGAEVAVFANKIMALEKSENLRRISMMKMKPRERYKEFLRIFGVEIERSFAVKDIADYLGMQPSYLSRLRAEYLKNKTGLIKYLQTVFFITQFI